MSCFFYNLEPSFPFFFLLNTLSRKRGGGNPFSEPKIMTKKPDQRNKKPYEKIQIVTPSNQLVTIPRSHWIKSQFLFKSTFEKVTLYPHPLISTPRLHHPHKYSTKWLSVMLRDISVIPLNCQKCNALAPTPDLLGDSDALKNHCSALFHTMLFSIDFFFLHHHAHYCLYIAYSTHRESAQSSWSLQLEALPDIHPPTPYTSSQCFCEYHHHGTYHPVITTVYYPLKDLLFLWWL